jgi:hypothetical protein
MAPAIFSAAHRTSLSVVSQEMHSSVIETPYARPAGPLANF